MNAPSGCTPTTGVQPPTGGKVQELRGSDCRLSAALTGLLSGSKVPCCVESIHGRLDPLVEECLGGICRTVDGLVHDLTLIGRKLRQHAIGQIPCAIAAVDADPQPGKIAPDMLDDRLQAVVPAG